MLRQPLHAPDLQQLWLEEIAKLKDDPTMAPFVEDVIENGATAAVLGTYFKDKDIGHKLEEAQTQVDKSMRRLEVEREAEHEMFAEFVREIFDKFDRDEDGCLNLSEFNALQAETGGPQLDPSQLESFVLEVNPNVKDCSRGLPLKSFSRLYLDTHFAEMYGTDVLSDHRKIFPEAWQEPGTIPDRELPEENMFSD